MGRNKNPYIHIYEAEKLTGKSSAQALKLALIQLTKDRETWGYQEKVKKGSTFGWRGFLKGGFFNAKTTAKNMNTVNELILKLDDLNQSTELAQTLATSLNHLSKGGDTHEFISYTLKEIAAIDYSTRPSNFISPSNFETLITKQETYEDGETWSKKLKDILKNKNLPKDLFNTSQNKLNLSSNISEHVKWAFNKIYQIAYPNGNGVKASKKSGIVRYIHGIQHVGRVAIYVPVIANLYRKHGDPAAIALTDEDCKLLQIAAVFHDAAREDEDEDKWDHESGIFLYLYLTRILKVDKAKAKLIAEATANKDPSASNGYFEIIENEKGVMTWRFCQAASNSKNIYQKIIHDADCLDILRARPRFDANYLDFYKDIASKKGNDLALEEMAHLITEARSLIEIQGDTFTETDADVKKKYNHENAYQALNQDIDKQKHPIISALKDKLIPVDELKKQTLIDLTPYDRTKGLTEENMRAAIRSGLVFARGIGSPSAVSSKHEEETLAQTEIRKTTRTLTIATRSTKNNNDQKHGNPYRSIAMLGYGANTFCNAGFLICELDYRNISCISTVDANTSHGKKADWVQSAAIVRKPIEVTTSEMKQLHNQLKLGGGTVHEILKGWYPGNHVEITYDITKYDALYYSNDPSIYNEDMLGQSRATHSYSALLQVIYLQNEYEQQIRKVKSAFIAKFGETIGTQKFEARFGVATVLPIFEYSGSHNTMRKVKAEEITEERIIEMWVAMCGDYMKKELLNPFGTLISELSLDDIKTNSMYLHKEIKYAKRTGPADANYSPALRDKINKALESKRQELLNEQVKQLILKINADKFALFSDELFFLIVQNPTLITKLKENGVPLEKIVREFSCSQDLFHNKSPISYFGGDRWDFIFSVLPNKLPDGFKINNNFAIPYFIAQSFRAYALCQQLGLEDVRNDIREKARQTAKNCIEQIKQEIQDATFCISHSIDDIGKIILLDKFLSNYNLTEEFQNDIKKFKADLFLIKIVTQNWEFHLCNQLFDHYQAFGWLDNQTLATMKFVWEKLSERILNTAMKFQLEDIADYALFSNSLKVDFKKNLMVSIANSSECFTTNLETALRRITKAINLSESNIDLFAVIVKKIAPCNRYKRSNTPNPIQWLQTVLILQEYVDKKTFSPDQIAIIEKRWAYICNKYAYIVQEGKDKDANYDTFINQLTELVKMKLLVPLDPNLMIVFNNHFLTYLASKDESIVAQAMKLHESLPGKDEREKIMEAPTMKK